jgi:RNA polymerase sigma-70 factor (ECF subfamily)
MDARVDIRTLLSAARRGAPDAIGRVFEAAREQLLRLADRELPDDVRPKIAPSDVVQETAVDVQRDFGKFVGTTPEELFAWLREILRNNVVDAVRHYRDAQKRDAGRELSLASASVWRAGEVLPELARSPDASAIRREEAAALSVILARLPADYRRVLELRYWNGLSFVDMAPLLGRSPDAVRKMWYRALERLNEELAAAGSTDAAAAAAQPTVPD